MRWKAALGRLRFVAPDTPAVRRDAKYLYGYITKLEKKQGWRPPETPEEWREFHEWITSQG